MKRLPIIALLAFASSASAGAQTELVDRAVSAWAKVKTARATFEQTITNAVTDRVLTSSGEFQQQRPSKLAVTFTDPAKDQIVADGKYVWLYLPSSAPDQVIKSEQTSAGTGTVDLSAQFLINPRARFAIAPVGTLVVNGHATHGFTFLPKGAAGSPFKTAAVWFDDADASIRQFEITDMNGLQRKIRFTSFTTNVPVDEKAFTFVVPKGVRIIER